MLLYTYISSHWRHVNITLHAHSSISINNESMYCDIDLIWCNISVMFFRDSYHRFAIFLPAAGSRLCRHMINALNIEKHMHIHVHVYGCSWHGLKQNRVVSHPIGLLNMWQNILKKKKKKKKTYLIPSYPTVWERWELCYFALLYLFCDLCIYYADTY